MTMKELHGDEYFQIEFPADADISTVDLTSIENMLGRWVKIPVALSSEEIVAPNGTQDLLADLYWELYKIYPKDKENIPDIREVNKAVLDMVRESPDWNRLRTQTTASISMSKLCASGLLVNLLKDEKIQEAMKMQEEAQRLEQESEQQQDDGEGDSKRQKKQKAQALIDEALKKLGKEPQKNGQGQPQQQKNQSGQGKQQQSVAKAVQDTKANSDEARMLAKSWSMEDGDNGEIDADEVARMLNQFKRQGKIQEVTRHMGRVKGTSMTTREQYSKVKGVTISRDGYTQNLQRMFPAEMALLRKDVNALVRAQKASEYCDRGLLGMIEESQPVEQGPLVIAVDESGSMSGDGILRAKGLALGLCLSALDNGQPFHAFGFSSTIETEVTSDAPKSDMMRWSVRFAGGGTNFDSAINYAFDTIEKSEHKHSSDFILITDGACDIRSDTRDRVKEMADNYGTRMISFGIDTDDSSYNCEAFEISDAYINVDSLDNLSQISELLTAKLVEKDMASS